jgi:hypothetical protein
MHPLSVLTKATSNPSSPGVTDNARNQWMVLEPAKPRRTRTRYHGVSEKTQAGISLDRGVETCSDLPGVEALNREKAFLPAAPPSLNPSNNTFSSGRRCQTAIAPNTTPKLV